MNTFALKEVLDYTVEEYSSTSTRGDILFSVNYAKDSTLSTTGERLDIRGGQGNYKIISLDHTKDVAFKSVLPIVDINAIAQKLGKSITTGASQAPKREVLTVDGSNQVELAQTPVSGTLKVYILTGTRDLSTEQTSGTPATTENEYSISGTTITLNATSCAEDSKVVVYYEYATGSNSKTIKITADDFPSFIRITGTGVVDDDVTGTRIPITFDIKKAKVKIDFDLTMQSDSATEINFDCDCYAVDDGTDKLFVDIVKLDDETA